jgi:hypothetical protein
MITGITAPAKIAVRPMILYQAATELSESATNSVRLEKDKNLRFIVYLLDCVPLNSKL